jgi:23S rRNA pseudouridine2604 synthase
MAHRKMCSRREAEKLIASGAVVVNGKVLTEQGVKTTLNAEITILEDVDDLLSKQVAILLHKPEGYVSNLPQSGEIAASELIKKDKLIESQNSKYNTELLKDVHDFAVAGRLDKASRGALILTNNGRLVKSITGSGRVKKVYIVRVENSISEHALKYLNGPVRLGGEMLRPMVIQKINEKTLKFELREGKKHQIRRVCRLVDLNVMSLYRTDVGELSVTDLPQGSWRFISQEEIDTFCK